MSESGLKDVDTVTVCVPDNIGRLVGKRISADRWEGVLNHGLPMPNFHLVTGIENRPLTGLEVSGAHVGFPNGVIMPIPSTLFRPTWEPRSALVLGDVLDSAHRVVDQAPRRILQRQVDRVGALDLQCRFASELEFYLYKTPYEQAHLNQFTSLPPAYYLHGDNDVLVSGYLEEFVRDIRRALASMAIDVETCQGEGGEGQYEVNLGHCPPVSMADRHVLYKHSVKALAQGAGLAATFLAKPSTLVPGSSGHVHISFTNSQDDPVLGDMELSVFARSFLAGLLAFTPELTILHAPFANSYRRLQPGNFVPINATWGWDNRTCLVRVIRGVGGCRFEFRLPGADMNPYHSFAAVLVAGLEGVTRELDLIPETLGDAESQPGVDLPRDVTEAVALFEDSQVAAEAFGAKVHAHLATLAGHERDATRRAVTDWEIARGFERA